MGLGIELAERRWLPDGLVRAGMRRIIAARSASARAGGSDAVQARNRAFREVLAQGPIARVPDLANDQHYEVPPALFEAMLGPRLKYSSCLWEDGDTLADAEERMLRRTCAAAGLEDGQRVLELGCGWGSLSLWMAEQYPGSRVEVVSNSAPQRRFIEGRAATRGLGNLTVRTLDMNDLSLEPGAWDRVVSVEMVEHMWNLGALLERVAAGLAPGGRVFVHHFAHAEAAYPYEDEGDDDWMARHFFSGGVMPSPDHLARVTDALVVREQGWISGVHYQRTLEAWLERLDRGPGLDVLRADLGREAPRQLQRWRMFLMACAELFGFRGGAEWGVMHVTLEAS